jgi:hypothetical protein
VPGVGADVGSWSDDEGHRLRTRGRDIDCGDAELVYRESTAQCRADLGCGFIGVDIKSRKRCGRETSCFAGGQFGRGIKTSRDTVIRSRPAVRAGHDDSDVLARYLDLDGKQAVRLSNR